MAIGMTKYLLSLVLLLGLSTSAMAQARRGLWFGIDYDLGYVLSSKAAAERQGLIANSNGAGNFALTLGYNISPQWSVGAGLSTLGLNNPEYLGLLGVHLEGQARLIRPLPRLVFGARLGSTFFDSTNNAFSFDANLFGHVSVGWELRRLLGPLGIVPSVGLRYVDFSYVRDGGFNPTQERSRSGRFVGFVSLSLVLN